MTTDSDAAAAGVDADPGPGVAAYLRFYRRLSASVAVVTAHDELGPVGLTASSVTSVSLRPPMLLACVNSDSTTLAAIRSRRVFAVHLLAEDQAAVADRFSAAGNGRHRFTGLGYRLVLGVPVLSQALAVAVCFVVGTHRHGDHTIVVGRLTLTNAGTGQPLIWHDRRYSAIAARQGATEP